MCTELLLDYAEKWYRATKSVQAHQNNVEIRSTPTEGKQTAQMKEWTTESRSVEYNTPAIPYGARDCSIENSQEYTSSDTVQPPLPR